MSEVTCPWSTKIEAAPLERRDVLCASIDGQPVSFRMREGQCWCDIHGAGKQHKLEDLTPEHAKLVARVKDYFDL